MHSMYCAFVLTVLVFVIEATPEAPFNRFSVNQPLGIPQRQTYNSRFLRLEAVPQQLTPYPAAGYRPQGEQFRLPSEAFHQQPQQKQHQPSDQRQPDTVYGPPEVATEEVTTQTDITTTDMPTTTAYVPLFRKENIEVGTKQVEEFQQEGVYYIYHPDGLLQRVVYATKSEDMGYTAKLTYKDVEPIKEPIYTYNPNTLTFIQIQL